MPRQLLVSMVLLTVSLSRLTGRLAPRLVVTAFTIQPSFPPIHTRFLATSSSASPKLYRRSQLQVKKDDGTKEQLYRADRVLANRSGRSRSECFGLLKDKRVVVKIGDRLQTVSGPSAKLTMQAELLVDGDPIPMPPPLLMAYHKPKWVLSVRRDPQGRPCLDESILPALHPVGRLDYDSQGLLLFSSSGPLTQLLLHPKHAVEKEYAAVVVGKVDETTLSRQLSEGVKTGEGIHTAGLVECTYFKEDQVSPYLEHLKKHLPPHYNQTDLQLRGYLDVLGADQLSTVRLTVEEGKHRMVRRMLANCGHPVVTLERRRFGPIALGDLPPGQSRELNDEERAWAESLLEDQQGSSKKKKRR